MRTDNNHKNDALVIGRFQPFHKGHVEVIKKVASECDKVIIGIGSAQYSNTLENPFTADERNQMISEVLSSENINNAIIVHVDDINNYSEWVKHVETVCPPFSIVYSNNPDTKKLFEEAGYETRKSPMYNRKEYSGEEVRKRIAEDKDWCSLVHPNVKKIIEDVDGVSRIKAIMSEKK